MQSGLHAVEGEEAERFDAGTGAPAAGVLGLDVRNAVTYFGTTPNATPVDLVAGPRDALNGDALLDHGAGAETDLFANHSRVHRRQAFDNPLVEAFVMARDEQKPLSPGQFLRE